MLCAGSATNGGPPPDDEREQATAGSSAPPEPTASDPGSPDPAVAIIFDREHTPGASSLAEFEGEPGRYLADAVVPLSEALSRQWDTDAHVSMYRVVDEDGNFAYPRVRKRSPFLRELTEAGCRVEIVALFLDYDLPKVDGKKQPWAGDSHSEFLRKLAELPGHLRPTYFYFTRFGARCVFALTDPVSPSECEGLLLGLMRDYLREGIELDSQCSDWCRLFRLSRVMRDGGRTEEDPFFDLFDFGEPLDPSTIEPGEVTSAHDVFAEAEEFDGDMPDLGECRLLLYEEGSRGRERMTPWLKDARRMLGGREAEEVLFRHRPLPADEHGGRNNAFTYLVGQTVGMTARLDSATPERVFALFVPTIEQVQAEDSEGDDWAGIVWSMVVRFWNAEQAQIAAEPEERQRVAEELGTNGTDTENAKLFAQLGRDDLRYCAAKGSWIAWDGSRWAPDFAGKIALRLTERVVEFIEGKVEAHSRAMAAAKAAGDDEEASLHSRVLKTAQGAYQRAASGPGRREMVNLGATVEGFSIAPEELDSHPHLLNFTNGTYDLREFAFRSHRREDYLTQCTGVAYDADARCPRYLSFSEGLFPDSEIRAFWQILLGLTITGEHFEEFFALLYGEGSNGKSTALANLHDVLGADYAKTAKRGLLKATRFDDSTKEYGLIDTKGARILSSVEFSANAVIDEESLKLLTGGDSVKGRHPYERLEEFTPTFSLFVAANDKPRVRDQSHGFWRRVWLIPFEAQFDAESAVKGMRSLLREEAPGILNFMIEGLRRYHVEGLNIPERVRLAVDEYRRESNPHEQFIAERCERAPDAAIPATRLWKAWREWAQENGSYFGTQTAFGRALADLGLPKSKSNGVYRYVGIRLRTFDLGGREAR